MQLFKVQKGNTCTRKILKPSCFNEVAFFVDVQVR